MYEEILEEIKKEVLNRSEESLKESLEVYDQTILEMKEYNSRILKEKDLKN